MPPRPLIRTIITQRLVQYGRSDPRVRQAIPDAALGCYVDARAALPKPLDTEAARLADAYLSGCMDRRALESR